MATAPKTHRLPFRVVREAMTQDATPEDVVRASLQPPGRHKAGDVINGKYVLRSVIGCGGMGAVWLARNLSLDIDVAIKLIRGSDASPDASRRLLREARAAARLVHPSIVRVFDFGDTEHGDPFIVMEVVTGESLADLLERRVRLPALEAVQLLLPIASALAAAHARGIVHRDIKPENVIVMTGDDHTTIPKLVDFGIAKVEGEGGARPITRAGSVLGTPDYMSPEQVRAVGDIDERTDVWAFSVLLYETIAGRRPFEGTSAIGVYAAIVTDEPTPVTDFGAGDDDLWAIIQGGLTKAPAARTPSMRVLGRALARWAQRRGVGADASGVSLTQHWLNEGLSGSNAATPDVIQAPASSPAPAARPFPRWALAAAGVLAVVCVTGAVALTRPNRGQRAELSLSAVASPREARLPAPDEPIQVSRFGDPPEPRAKAAAPVSSQPAHRPPAKKAPHDAPPPHKQPIKAGF